MTKYYYTCEEDHQLIEKSFQNIAYIILGRINEDKINAFLNYWRNKVSNVNVFQQGTFHLKINQDTPGICRLDKSTNQIIIEMFGYKGANKEKLPWIKHEGTHEFCHSFVDLLPGIMSQHPHGIIKDGVIYENHMGMIRESVKETGELVGQHYYGKMFNETMMDIISSMAINYFDSNNASTTADDILHNNFNSWGNEETAYSIFTSITRLTIAAFSNIANINYDSIIRNGYGIFGVTTKLKNGEEHKANDFLYGIVYDSLHIEEEFDRFMGDDSYRIFCEYLDRLFLLSLGNQKLPSEEVKRVMNILPIFLNKKINYYLQNNLMDLEQANAIVSNFNRIWNSMQIEYDSYFSLEDIEYIARR